ncbi:MAG: (2Fe-2S) ferredoxin domain-containing protein [Bacteroidales bacterium]|nr:(2Fe-2S) ferredoxin domain-containing protein [Bacteroidales bacterium]
MNKIKNLADLRKMKDELQNKIQLRVKSDSPDAIIQVKVGMATSGIASGAKEIMNYFTEEFEKRNIDALVIQVGDMGYCYAEPTIEITRPGEDPVVFGYVTIAKADEIIEKYIKNGELIEGIIPTNYNTIDK